MKAKFYAVSLFAYCPKCNEPLPNPKDESFKWDGENFLKNQPKEVKCFCGQTVKIERPRRVEF